MHDLVLEIVTYALFADHNVRLITFLQITLLKKTVVKLLCWRKKNLGWIVTKKYTKNLRWTTNKT